LKWFSRVWNGLGDLGEHVMPNHYLHPREGLEALTYECQSIPYKMKKKF